VGFAQTCHMQVCRHDPAREGCAADVLAMPTPQSTGGKEEAQRKRIQVSSPISCFCFSGFTSFQCDTVENYCVILE
jgi:hypothetical protein